MNENEDELDFTRDKLIATISEPGHPRKGQHIHVGAEVLLRELREHIERTTKQEALPPAIQQVPAVSDDRIEFITRTLQNQASQMEELRNRIGELEQRPQLTADDLRNLTDGLNTRFKVQIDKQISSALGDMNSSIATLRTKTIAGPDSDQIGRLAETVHSFGKYVREIEKQTEQRESNLEMKYAAIAAHLDKANTETTKVKAMVYRMARAINHETDEA